MLQAQAHISAAGVDAENDGQPNITATGDGADENGIEFLTPIMPGQNYQIRVTVSDASYLNAWIDFDNSGTLDVGERIFSNEHFTSAGTFTFTRSAPTGTLPTTLHSRFRLTKTDTQSGDLPTGEAYSGEVEDYALMSLGDFVWKDNGAGGGTPNNGIKDGGEVGISGVELRLLDNSGNAILDGTGNPIKTTTDSNGQYRFTGLMPGTYRVRILNTEFASGKPLYDYYSTTDQAGFNTPDNNLNENADENGIDNADPTTNATNGITTGLITLSLGSEPVGGADGDNDSNSNMTVDFGFLQYDYGDDPNSYSTTLASTGARHILDGSTYLGEDVDAETDGLPGTIATSDDADANDDEDGIVFKTSIQPGQSYEIEVTASMNGYLNAWIDFNGDGDFADAGEQIRSDADGALSLTAGKQTLTFTAPGLITDPPFASTLYSRFRFTKTTGQGNSSTGTAPNGEVEDYALMSLGNVIWYDKNNNGIMDGAEAGIGNIKVDLYNETSPGNYSYFGTTTTDSTVGNEGRYLFTGLPPGNYKVTIPASEFGAGKSLNGYFSTTDTTTGGADPENSNNENTDENGGDDPAPATNGITTKPVTLALGSEPDTAADGNDTNSNMTVDFGFYTEVNLGNLVWHDINNDGIKDAGENGIVGVELELFRAGDDPTIATPVATQPTGVGGLYNFDHLAPGAYFVYIASPPTNYPASSSITVNTDNQTNNDDNGIQNPVSGIIVGSPVISPVIILTSTIEPDAATDTDGTNGDLTIDFGFYHPLSLGNFVWDDTDGDGIQDAGEPGIENAIVSLFKGDGTTPATDSDGNLVASKTTDANGNYLFTNLPPGDYVVKVSASGYIHTKGKNGVNNPSDPDDNDDADSNGYDDLLTVPIDIQSRPVTLLSESETSDGDADPNTNPSVDFGFYKVPSLGNFVWHDVNMDGVQDDTGEAGIPNVTVRLYDALTDTVVDTQITDANGSYTFNMTTYPPGDYYLIFTNPDLTYTFTSRDSGGDDTKDSDADPSTGKTIAFTVESGKDYPTWDAGMYHFDMGDLPEDATHTYGTTVASNPPNGGARHTLDTVTYLGANVDSDTEGWTSVNADGDDTNSSDDENGVTFKSAIQPDSAYQIDVVASTAGVLNAWIDFNGDGDFDDTGEKIASDYVLNNGANTLNLNAPSSSDPFATTLYSRFRFTKTAGQGGENPDGIAYSGEVEDYALMSIGNIVWDDGGAGTGGIPNNGIKDGTELGISGVKVDLYVETATPGIFALYGTTATDSTGHYLFTGLNPGNYKVQIPSSEFSTGKSLYHYVSTTDKGGNRNTG